MGVYTLYAVCFGFLSGVAFASSIVIGFWGALFSVLVAVVCFFFARFVSTHTSAYIICGTFILGVGLGILRMSFEEVPRSPFLDERVGSKVEIEGAVFEEPDVRDRNVRFSIRTDDGAGVVAIAPLHTDISYGDRVRAEGTLRLPHRFETGEGRTFNYPMFLAKSGIAYEISFARVEKVGTSSRNPIKAFAITLKQTFLEGVTLALSEPAAGLAGGITVGDKRGLGSEWSDIFRTVGLTHIVVLSGYNIMIVIYALQSLVARFHISRSIEVALSIAIAFLFALMTGLASASVRASAMASLAVLGKQLGRVYLAQRALVVVATLMVAWNPYILLFDPGFQLSVVATWGMIAFSERIGARLKRVSERLGLREILATTLATQVTVLPLLLYQSGQLSLISLPANMLVLVVVPWAMLASFVAGLGGIMSETLAFVIGFPAYILLSYILFAAEWLSRVPFASLSVGSFGIAWLAAGYLILFAYSLKKEKAAP